MDKYLSELIRVSSAVGEDSSLVQGGGGNTSVKTDDNKYMYIKASGTALKDMSFERGWRRLNIEAVLAVFQDKALAKMACHDRELEMVNRLLATCDDDVPGDVRPSVESALHAILGKYVIHLHAIAVLAYACARNGKDEILKLFADKPLPPLWITYADPGLSLGQRVFKQVGRYEKEYGSKPAIMILEKHGVLVTAESAEGALALVRKVIDRCVKGLRRFETDEIPAASAEQIELYKKNIARAVLEVTGENVDVSFRFNPVVAQFLASAKPSQMLRAGALTPDEMGFVNGPILWLKDGGYKTAADKIRAAIGREGQRPTVFLVKGVGLFIAAEAALAGVIKDIVIGSLFIRRNAYNMGGINALNRRQRDFVENWEAEKFRVEIASSQNKISKV